MERNPVRARRVAALYDLHGNPFALQAVIDEVEQLDVDVIVFGGDLAWGPLPRATVEAVMALAGRSLCVRGNGDREMAPGSDRDASLTGFVAEVHDWCVDQLTEPQRSFLGQLAEIVVVNIDVLGPVLFCHGSPRTDDEIITPATPEARLSVMLEDVDERVIVCGHTHVQFDRVVGETRVVNAGSVGMPYEDRPGAYWALLGPGIELRRTDYDFSGAAVGYKQSGCPHADEFAKDLLAPPPRAAAIDHFEASATRAPAD